MSNPDRETMSTKTDSASKRGRAILVAFVLVAIALTTAAFLDSGDSQARGDSVAVVPTPSLGIEPAAEEVDPISSLDAVRQPPSERALPGEPKLQSDQEETVQLPPREFRSVFEEIKAQRKQLWAELASLTEVAYNDAFDRGDCRELADTSEAGDISGKLVSFRFQPDGKILLAELPPAQFEHAYSIKSHLDEIEGEYREMKAELRRSEQR